MQRKIENKDIYKVIELIKKAACQHGKVIFMEYITTHKEWIYEYGVQITKGYLACDIAISMYMFQSKVELFTFLMGMLKEYREGKI